MTSSFLENVKMYLFSQAMSKYCMIYFGYSLTKGFRFLEKIIYKKSDIKILFMDYHLAF